MKGIPRTTCQEKGLFFPPLIGPKMFVLLQDLVASVGTDETEFNVLIKASRYFYSP